jgi:hypothetical protein
MPSPSSSFLSKIISQIPDGAFWMTGKLLKDILKEIQKDRARGGDNIEEIQTSSGRFFKSTSGDGSQHKYPFDIIISNVAGVYKARLFPGSVNQLLPDNIFSEFTFTDGALVKVKVRALSDGVKITSATMVLDTSEAAIQTPVASALPSTAEILVGIISDNVPYRTIGNGSISLTGEVQYRTDKSPAAAPGELPYTEYFVLAPTIV